MSWTYTQTDERRLLALEKELESLQARYTNDNPKVLKVLTEIAELRKSIAKAHRDLPDSVIY